MTTGARLAVDCRNSLQFMDVNNRLRNWTSYGPIGAAGRIWQSYVASEVEAVGRNVAKSGIL